MSKEEALRTAADVEFSGSPSGCFPILTATVTSGAGKSNLKTWMVTQR